MALKEVAKFATGFETFHALFHTYLWLSGTTITLFGITATPTWSMASTVMNGIIALALGFYAWRGRTKTMRAELADRLQ